MKRQKTKKSKPAMTLEATDKSGESPGKPGLVIKCDYRTESFEYWPRPSELELATLAARLARAEKLDPKQLVNEAWSLYKASCRKIQEDHLIVKKLMETNDDHYLEQAELLPQPKRYPMTFAEMERLLLPKLKGRTAERAALFREYSLARVIGHSILIAQRFRVVTYWDLSAGKLDALREEYQVNIAKQFGELRAKQYDVIAYAKFATAFLPWYGKWQEAKRHEVKAANARKGWEKRSLAKQTKTGARPKVGVLKEILEESSPGA